MAASSQLPRHVSAHLSSLTSRPGVQSTLILSRKDGSIIQTTGLLATRLSPSSTPPATTPTPAPIPAAPDPSSSPDQQATTTDLNTSPTSTAEEIGETSQHQQPEPQPLAAPYKPSQAETLAAHIFAFVSSASALSTSLSKPPSDDNSGINNETDYKSSPFGATRSVNGNGHVGNQTTESDGQGQGHEREEDDEVKLLRLRTKIHEIIIIPDRKFLLCVVHDLSGSSGGAGGGGSGGGGSKR
ncbi:hypothetical protein AJ79_02946 [Helicocarpus griseus UAMH5409]|uniref:Roadblock/LAMTOR2 domain-containing protein n=1 Tax=Helicocarpus griseus UAMH5409 TaxID=1447875 RepID=A0A2B7Y0Q2_9EURO|nr:hypothetical protein AJ79_02946 [Helicocarpus griseus UAMH5409]